MILFCTRSRRGREGSPSVRSAQRLREAKRSDERAWFGVVAQHDTKPRPPGRRARARRRARLRRSGSAGERELLGRGGGHAGTCAAGSKHLRRSPTRRGKHGRHVAPSGAGCRPPGGDPASVAQKRTCVLPYVVRRTDAGVCKTTCRTGHRCSVSPGFRFRSLTHRVRRRVRSRCQNWAARGGSRCVGLLRLGPGFGRVRARVVKNPRRAGFPRGRSVLLCRGARGRGRRPERS